MTDTKDLSAESIARRVLRLEADALIAFSEAPPADFAKAVDAILGIKGRVIVAGVGKSGHVARKIAATLASTGTPAMFVHPTEASHGDLGMITPDDAIIAMSKSGETRELSDVIQFAKRFALPLIGMTAKAGICFGQSLGHAVADAERSGSLRRNQRADHLHYLNDRTRRRFGGGLVGKTRLHKPGLPRLPSGRLARRNAENRAGFDAFRR